MAANSNNSSSVSSPTNLDFFKNTNYPPDPQIWWDDYAEVYEPRDENEVIIERFLTQEKVLRGRTVEFTKLDTTTGELVTVEQSAADQSRYTTAGRKKIMRKLRKRISGLPVQGVLLTLTVDPKEFSKKEAWEQIWKWYQAFRRDLWKWLKKQGRKENPQYLAVIEQHKSGYPHLHVAYPGLRFLAPKEIVNKAWKMGFAHVEGGRRKNGSEVMVSPLGYVCKYISKMSGWTLEGLAHLWHAKARLYNASRRLYTIPKKPPQPGWLKPRFHYVNEEIRHQARLLTRIKMICRTRSPARRERDVFAELSTWFGQQQEEQMF